MLVGCSDVEGRQGQRTSRRQTRCTKEVCFRIFLRCHYIWFSSLPDDHLTARYEHQALRSLRGGVLEQVVGLDRARFVLVETVDGLDARAVPDESEVLSLHAALEDVVIED